MIQSLKRLQLRLVRTVREQRDRGATMVEYALLVVFIAMIALAGVKLLGTDLSNFFTDFAGDL